MSRDQSQVSEAAIAAGWRSITKPEATRETIGKSHLARIYLAMKAVDRPEGDEVERVARAIAASDGFDGFNPAFDWRPFEPNARAAIEAMHPIGDVRNGD